jgi:hypothetical protein
MSLCAILAGSWDSILTFFTNDDIDWPCGWHWWHHSRKWQ